jgi:hypothetical protein
MGTLLVASPTIAQDAETAAHFGFDGLDVIPVGPNAGALLAADVDGDGLTDLVIANNHKSRIEILRQRPNASPEDVVAPARVNELPEHWRFERIEIPMSIEIAGIDVADVDGDGLADLIAAGRPDTIQIIRQTASGTFESMRRHRVKGLSPTRDGLVVADVAETDGPLELIGLVEGRLRIWPLGTDGRLGVPIELASGDDRIIAVLVEDYDGDGLDDIAGIVGDSEAPIRIWLASREDGRKTFGPELRFEAPPLVEAAAVRMAGADAAGIAVIERPTRRVVMHAFRADGADDGEPSFEVHGLTDPGQRDRDLAIADLDGDGLLEILATDRERNAIATWWQTRGRGLGGSRTSPTFAQPDSIEAGDPDGDGVADVFVLSEEEGVVGRATVEDGAIGFPEPLPLPAGHEPVTMRLVRTADGPALAVVAKNDKSFALDLLSLPGNETTTVDLGRSTRGPDAILDLDADQDGRPDLLLFTEDRPMTLVRSTADGFVVLDKDRMPQFGLVSAAGALNTGRFDIDGDGRDELLVADRNYVRALRFDPDSGWRVVAQMNADGASKLVSVAVLGDRIVAADREGRRLLVFEQAGSGWMVAEDLPVRGLVPESIEQGPFHGVAGEDDLLLVGRDAFAVVRLEGDRPRLVETTSWRPNDKRTVPHELGIGDVNGDDHLDVVALDAGRQAAIIMSLSDRGRLVPMTDFTVFETKIFSGGEPREYEPREVIVADVTGDGAADLVMVAHDRILVMPQSVLDADS